VTVFENRSKAAYIGAIVNAFLFMEGRVPVEFHIKNAALFRFQKDPVADQHFHATGVPADQCHPIGSANGGFYYAQIQSRY